MKNQRTATTIRLEDRDREAIAAIKEQYGVTSDNDAIRLALRMLLREIEQRPPTPKQGTALSSRPLKGTGLPVPD
jgi:hypothetical protein